MAFVRRKPGTVCPVCERADWCSVSDDGKVARCMRVESARESTGADGTLGWLHALETPMAVEVPQEKVTKATLAEVKSVARSAYEHKLASAVRAKLAQELGVSVASLDSLRVGYGCDRSGAEWSSWPSRDGRGNVVGVSRRYSDGSKKTMPGHRCGVYYPLERKGLLGPVLIVEGGSDVAAALTVGLPAIGRPSNTGGADVIQTVLGEKVKAAVVVGERDENPERRGTLQSCPVDCRGCLVCWPGLAGAKIVAKKLGCRFVLPPEGVKDFRECVRKGVAWWELVRCCCVRYSASRWR